MTHLLHDGATLYAEHIGNKNADFTLVFLNGLSQSTQAWIAMTPELEQEYGIIRCDLVFQGRSGRADTFRTYDQHAADITNLLDTLEIKNPVLIGISYGSAVAQHALVNFPDRYRGAVLLSTFAHKTALFNAIGESWKTALKAGGYALMLDIMLPIVLGASYFEQPLLPIEFLKETRVAANINPDNLLQLMKATDVREDYRKRLNQINVPVHIIHGAEDLLIPVSVAKQVADNIPNSKFDVLQGAGHTLNLEAIPDVNRRIKEFMSVLKINSV